MVIVKNLTKIFKSQKKEYCTALDNVSFELPRKGFVFIVGKSGSGKTTLLNMISGISSFNSGEIEVEGTKLSTLKGEKLDYYRNEKIGFIFQDYQLLDNLTVFENINLALEFLNIKDDERIRQALKDVDLVGYENRYPKELSGGEKQRVAIARAIVKKPSIILADEPTGNLDRVTTKQVLNILKTISKDRLVLIVSHNIFDAHEFADYILELSYGKLIGTYKRNEENTKSIEIKDGILRLPLHKDLIEEDKNLVINCLDNNINDVIQDDLDFKQCELKFSENFNTKPICKRHISLKNSIKQGFNFIKQGFSSIIVFSLIIASLFSLINAANTIKNYDDKDSFNHLINNYSEDIMPLEPISYLKPGSENFTIVYDEEIEQIKQAGYKGDIFYRYTPTPGYPDDYFITNRVDILLANEKYLTDRFNNIELHCKNDEIKPYGLYFTDYYVDIWNLKMPYKRCSYESFCKTSDGRWNFHCNGVIKTDYKTKYKEIYEVMKNSDGSDDFIKARIKELDKKKVNNFYRDCELYYSNAFSFNENFINDLYLGNEYRGYNRVYSNIEYNGNVYQFKHNHRPYFLSVDEPKNGIKYSIYKELTGREIDFGDDCNAEIEPFTINANIIDPENFSNTLCKEKITFDFVFSDKSSQKYYDFILYQPSVVDYLKHGMFLRSIILSDAQQYIDLVNESKIHNHLCLGISNQKTVHTASRLQNVFDKVFGIIMILLIACCFISLIFYGISTIKKNMRNIGILKSFGARNKDILATFFINVGLMIISTVILYCGLAYLFMFVIDKILISSIYEASLELLNIYGFRMIFNKVSFYLINIAAILVLTLFSYLFMFIKINKLKPTELIKNSK